MLLREEIKEFFKGEVEDRDEFLNKASKDWSIFKIKPELVVFPKDKEDIKKLVQFVSKKRKEGDIKISLTMRAAGTDMSGGPLNNSIIVDVTRHMRGVLEIKEGNFGSQKSKSGFEYKISGLGKVLPGTFYRDFEKETKKKGLLMPCYPASKNLCAVGGMVANNGAGEKTLKYGQNKDFIHSLMVVLDDGNEYEILPMTKAELEARILQEDRYGEICRLIWNLYKRNADEIKEAKPKTTKNSSGYLIWDVWNESKQVFDMTKLFTGSQGTLGVVTEITYKLVALENHSRLLVVFLDDFKDIAELTKRLMRYDLETLEVYDDNTLKFAIKFFRDFIKQKGLGGFFKSIIQFLPEFWMILRGGIPKLFVLAEFVSNDLSEIEREARMAQNEIKELKLRTKVTKTEKETEKYFEIRRDSFRLLSDHSKSLRTAAFIDDVVIPIENLKDYLNELLPVLNQYDLLYTVAGHLGNGNLHIIPLMNFKNPKTKEIIKELTPRVYELVSKYEGSITGEHNDGIIRTPYLKEMFGENMVSVFVEIKKICDPANIFNPGKKVDISVEESHKYISG